MTESNRVDYYRTHKKLNDTFIEILSQKPLHQISVKEITTKASLGRSTFYLHYEDKYSILEEIKQDLFKDLLRINATFYQFDLFNHDSNTPFPYITDTYDWVLKNRRYIQVLLGVYGDPIFIKEWKDYISIYFLKAFEYNGVKIEQKDIISIIIGSLLIDTINYWINRRGDLSAEELSIITGKVIQGAISKFF